MDVFVISEDPDMLDWTKEVLDSREERLKVVTASTPEGALRLLGDGDFDMIISDHKMLKDNGSALLKVISEKMEKMEEPLIILLDKDQEGMVVKTLSPGELNGDHEEVLHSLLTHDLLNKLRLIRGDLQVWKLEYDVSKEGKDHILTIEERVNDSLELIRKISELKEEKEKGTRNIDLISVLKNTVRALEGQMGGMELDLDIDEENVDQYTVKAGPLLREVFSNIIENAVKYSDGERIELALNECGEEVVCSIEDDGGGIPEEKKDLVFEKGYTTGKEDGSGLGLFIVKELLKYYGGSVEVKDSGSGGARFDVRLKKG